MTVSTITLFDCPSCRGEGCADCGHDGWFMGFDGDPLTAGKPCIFHDTRRFSRDEPCGAVKLEHLTRAKQ